MRSNLILLLFLTTPVLAGEPSSGQFKDWIPPGWKLLQTSKGDLNKDGRDDVALVLEEKNPKKIKKDNNLSPLPLNFNKRRLLVLLREKSGYQELIKKDDFLPSESSEENSCLVDPLVERGVKIKKGVLQIELNYWFSCGSYGTTHETFKFRLENDRLRLIGRDSLSFSRNSGDQEENSKNFLTGQEKIITGRNKFEKELSNPKISWKPIEGKKEIYLDEMTLK